MATDNTIPEPAKQALDQAFAEHRGMLLRTLARIVGSVATAEDLVQETYLRVAAAIRAHPIDHLAPFLYQTARNLAFDHLRSERRRGLVVVSGISDDILCDVPSNAVSPETALGDRQALGHIDAALATLTERQRQILVLHKLHDCPQAEIANRLGVSLSTVQKDLRTALGVCLAAFARLDH
jgi:RNA polymerase sigma factor (sigma-70 family)